MAGATTKGIRYIGGLDAAATIDDLMQQLAEDVDSRLVAGMTTVQRDALAGATKWVGRTIFNTTKGHRETWDGATWLQTEVVDLASGAFDGATLASAAAIPEGLSIKRVVAAEAGWPVAADGEVRTWKRPGDLTVVSQEFQTRPASGAPRVWRRRWNSGGAAWLPWEEMGKLGTANDWSALQRFLAGVDVRSGGLLQLFNADNSQWNTLQMTTGLFSLGTWPARLQNDLSVSGYLKLGASFDALIRRHAAGAIGIRNAADSAHGDLMANWVYAAAFAWNGDGSKFIGWGNGSPEGAVTASVGAIWMRNDGGNFTTAYVKVSGTGNTGWKPMRPQIEAKLSTTGSVTWSDTFAATPFVVCAVLTGGSTGTGKGARITARSTTGASYEVYDEDGVGDADAQVMVIAVEAS